MNTVRLSFALADHRRAIMRVIRPVPSAGAFTDPLSAPATGTFSQNV